ncbi:MAG: acyl-CoA dehydrogenase family protein [Thermodesulfobacteriota bacterium]
MYASDNKELSLLDKSSLEFAKKVLAPGRETNDHYPFGPFFDPVVQKAFELDFFHILLPEDLGGVGQGIEALCVVLANICREDSSLGGIMLTNAFAQNLLMAAGCTDVLKDLAAGAKKAADFLIACPVLCNPAQDRPMLAARQDGDGYRLNGTAEYVVLGGMAGHGLLPALVSGQTAWFWVDLSIAGISRSGPVVSHGMHACPAEDLTFKDVPARLVGTVEEGGAYFKKVSETMQLAAVAMAAGVMRGSLEEALGYSRQRSQGGRKIKDWSELQMLLSGMAVQVHVAEMLVSRACQSLTGDEKNWRLSVQAAAIHVLSAMAPVVNDGIQVMGGVGYMKDFGQEKRFRDAGHIQALLGYLPLKKLDFIRQLL